MSYLCYVGLANGFLDFTCSNDNPRIDALGDYGNFIGGYKSGNDTDASVSFRRTIDTGTGSGLPVVYALSNHHAAPARILKMNSYSQKRIGAFSCIADKHGVKENITTIVIAENSKLHHWKHMI